MARVYRMSVGISIAVARFFAARIPLAEGIYQAACGRFESMFIRGVDVVSQWSSNLWTLRVIVYPASGCCESLFIKRVDAMSHCS